MSITISVVIAVYNGEDFLKNSLPAITESADAETEIILVNDGSTDKSAEIGKRFEVRIINCKQRSGAAKARNIGVEQANGEIILFVDADVVVQSDTIEKVRRIFSENPQVSAVFGSYDDQPGEPDFFSQYRNLMHHFFHQQAGSESQTFWSGLGAINKNVFLEAGGFDVEKFKIPSVEDIELGYRLRSRGQQILLVPHLQAKHLKKWTFYSILRTDFWQRAVPWVELLLLNPQIEHNLNATTSQKISAVFTGLFILSLAVTFWSWWFTIPAILFLIGIFLVNKEFYLFFLKRKGFSFTLGVLPMHLLYFTYSSAAFAFSWFNLKILGRTIVVR